MDEKNYSTICSSCHRPSNMGCGCRAFNNRDQEELAEMYSNDEYYKDEYKHVD